eukprot:5172879-Pyramimonas_sp.AAC.1
MGRWTRIGIGNGEQRETVGDNGETKNEHRDKDRDKDRDRDRDRKCVRLGIGIGSWRQWEIKGDNGSNRQTMGINGGH